MLMEPKAQVLVPRKNVVKSLAMRRYQPHEDLKERGTLILGLVTLALRMLMDHKALVLVPRKYVVKSLAIIVYQPPEYLREHGALILGIVLWVLHILMDQKTQKVVALVMLQQKIFVGVHYKLLLVNIIHVQY